MKLVQLLTGAAAAALLAGAATAQVVTVDATSGIDAAGETLAAEIDLSTAGQTANLVINLDFTGPAFSTLGGGDNVDFTVNLTGFEFTRVITSADFVAAGADANCAFAIQDGGGNTGTTVTFRSTGSVNACADADVNVTLPVEVTAANANFSWSSTLVGPGTSLNGATYDATPGGAVNPLVPTADKFSIAIADGQAPTDLTATDFILFGASTEDVFGTAAVVDNGAAIYADLAGGALAFDTVATDNNVLTITLEDITGIAYVELDVSANGADGGVDPQCVPSGTTCAITLTGAQLQGSIAAARDIVIVSENDNTAPISAQDLSASLSLEAENGFAVSGITGGSGDLDSITRDDGLNTDEFTSTPNGFEWVSVRASGGTNNAFRVTGLNTDLSASGACIEVNAGHSNTTIANNGWNCVAANVFASADGTWTATFGSADLNAALGAGTGNADVTFRVRRSDASGGDGANNANLEIRRLLSKNGIVTGTGFDGNATN